MDMLERKKYKKSGNGRPSTIFPEEVIAPDLVEELLEATSDGLWICDATPRLIWINSNCEQLNDIDRDVVVGLTVDELLRSGNFDEDVTRRVIASRQPCAIVQKVRSGRTLLVNAAPVFDRDGNVQYVVGTERDLTELNMLREQLDSIQKLQEKYQSELRALSSEHFGSNDLIATSEAMKAIVETCIRIADFDTTVLLTGQSGTGKSRVANFIHNASSRQTKPFLSLNCGAIPPTLVEAELFGYVEGAFSGAKKGGKPGLIEAADGGTLFLDEIDSFSFELQVKLLTFLDTQSFIRVGDNRVKKVDVRLIVATNQNLQEKVSLGEFREDLLYRLNVLPICLPPLAERSEDIPLLIHHILSRLEKRYGQKRGIKSEAVDVLCRHGFPGNVRELENILERAFVLCRNSEITSIDLPDELKSAVRLHRNPNEVETMQSALNQVERRYLEQAIQKYSRQTDIADWLNVSQPTVTRLLKKHQLSIQK